MIETLEKDDGEATETSIRAVNTGPPAYGAPVANSSTAMKGAGAPAAKNGSLAAVVEAVLSSVPEEATCTDDRAATGSTDMIRVQPDNHTRAVSTTSAAIEDARASKATATPVNGHHSETSGSQKNTASSREHLQRGSNGTKRPLIEPSRQPKKKLKRSKSKSTQSQGHPVSSKSITSKDSTAVFESAWADLLTLGSLVVADAEGRNERENVPTDALNRIRERLKDPDELKSLIRHCRRNFDDGETKTHGAEGQDKESKATPFVKGFVCGWILAQGVPQFINLLLDSESEGRYQDRQNEVPAAAHDVEIQPSEDPARWSVSRSSPTPSSSSSLGSVEPTLEMLQQMISPYLSSANAGPQQKADDNEEEGEGEGGDG